MADAVPLDPTAGERSVLRLHPQLAGVRGRRGQTIPDARFESGNEGGVHPSLLVSGEGGRNGSAEGTEGTVSHGGTEQRRRTEWKQRTCQRSPLAALLRGPDRARMRSQATPIPPVAC